MRVLIPEYRTIILPTERVLCVVWHCISVVYVLVLYQYVITIPVPVRRYLYRA